MSVQDNEKFDLSMILMITAVAILAVVVVFLIIDSEHQDPLNQEIDDNKTAWTEERAAFNECLTRFMDTYNDVDYYQCERIDDNPLTTTVWESKSPSEVCRNNCTPVYYPKWKCASTWERPDFTSINTTLDISRYNLSDISLEPFGIDRETLPYSPALSLVPIELPVTHNGFVNWTWPHPYGGGIWLNVSEELLAQIYVNLMLQNRTYRNLTTVTCGYKKEEHSLSDGNLTGEICSCDGSHERSCGVPGAGIERAQKNNYVCCVRIADKVNEGSLSRNFCVTQHGVADRISCTCEEVMG